MIEWSWIQRNPRPLDGETPVWHNILPCSSNWVGQELDGGLRQRDRWKPERVEGVDAASQDAEANPNHPHAEGQTGKGSVIFLEANACGIKDVLAGGTTFI